MIHETQRWLPIAGSVVRLGILHLKVLLAMTFTGGFRVLYNYGHRRVSRLVMM